MLNITVQSHLTMLQFSKTVYNSTAKLTPWRFISFTSTFSSVASEPNIAEQKIANSNVDKDTKERDAPIGHGSAHSAKQTVSSKKATIDSLIENKISSASSINDLLDLVKIHNISNKHVLKIMSSVTNYINSGKVQFSDIQTDTRFIELQKLSNTKQHSIILKNNMYSNLSTSRMVEIMVAFSRDKNRDIPKLKLLSLNILEYNEQLTVRQCSNLLYCMANLNFHNKMLLNKIANDLLQNLPLYTNAIVVNYVMFSFGLLRYKHKELLDTISKWILQYSGRMTQKDINIFLCTFAGLAYFGNNVDLFIQKYANTFKEQEWSCIDDLIDFVWALVVLNHAKNEHISSVLNSNVTEQDLSIPKKFKLLNIDGAAKNILTNYDGPVLHDESPIFKLEIQVRKSKEPIIDAVMTALKKLLLKSCFRTCVNTNMGFIIDIECQFDSNWKPISVNAYNENKNGKRLAIMVHDYYDYCTGNEDLTGVVVLQKKLLEAKGYTVLDISYQDINPTDKVQKHVDYLQRQFKIFMKR